MMYICNKADECDDMVQCHHKTAHIYETGCITKCDEIPSARCVLFKFDEELI